MLTRNLVLAAAVLSVTGAHAQYGMNYMANPAMMLNPAMMINPMTIMAPMGGIGGIGGMGGMNPVQYMSNPYLNPTSTLMPYLNPVGGMGGNPYVMPPQPPRQQTGFFPYMPAQAAPVAPAYRGPQAGYYPMMPAASPAPAPAYRYGAPAGTP
jgi:hypothetical protein